MYVICTVYNTNPEQKYQHSDQMKSSHLTDIGNAQ